jgi:hypothetical protein
MDWLIVVSSSAPRPEKHHGLRGVPRSPNQGARATFSSGLAKKDSIPDLSSQKLPELPIESKRNLCGGL